MSYMKHYMEEENLSGCFDYEQQMHEEEHKALTEDAQYAEWSNSYTQESVKEQDNGN